ncbi:MAG: Zn-ribbon domain-containing OB-fold protein [Promethearchaeota archaeon]
MSVDKEITIQNYLDFIKQEKLMGSKCKDCGNIDLPPRKICSKCLGTNTEWVDLTNQKGTLSTFSCVHVGTTRFVKRGYNMKNPYAFGIVTLESGPAVTGLLIGVDPKNPESIKVGMPMKVTFVKTVTDPESQQEQVDLAFEPV